MSCVRKNVGCFPGLYVLFVGSALLSAIPGVVRAEAFDDYRLVQTFELPAGAGPFNILTDGRIIALVDDTVHVETAPGSRSFTLHGTLPSADVSLFGAVFIRVSPDGTKIAVGNNGGASGAAFQVGVFDFASLTGEWFSANHFDAAWFDDTHLALTAGDFANPSVVTVLDTTSPDPSNPTNPTVIGNIGGASGGIAFDTAGNLYTGNGFSFGSTDTVSANAFASRLQPPHGRRFLRHQLERSHDAAAPYRIASGTGTVKAFDNASWTASLAGGAPVDFEIDGTLVVDVLSASPLGFDAEGNLFVGGGDAPPDNDAIALVRASAVTAALAGMGSADPTDPAQVRLLDPIMDNPFNFYSANYNPVTGELYVRDFGDPTVYVYSTVAAIPTASQWGLVSLALLMTTAGTLLVRSRVVSSAVPTGR